MLIKSFKLFENKLLFTEISSDEYYADDGIVIMSKRNQDILLNVLKDNRAKVVKDGICIEFQIDYVLDNQIYEMNDEYFLIMMEDDYTDLKYYRCDSVEGVIDCLQSKGII
jgi:hypothetical protein